MQHQNIAKQTFNSAKMKSKLQDMVDKMKSERGKLQIFLDLSLKQDLKFQNMLQEWPKVQDADYFSTNRECCTPDTRTNILKQLHSWVADDSLSCPPIFWISGMAGTGKSTIAKTICEAYSKKYGEYQLGTSFFCSRQLPELRDQRNVIPTVVYELSRSCTALQGELVAVDPKAIKKQESHVSSLLLGPWKKVAKSQASKWLIVIDALDELQNNGGYNILKQLLEGITGVRGLKILVTSRPDHNMVNVWQEQLSSKTICCLEDVEKNITLEDISRYLNTKLDYLVPKCRVELSQLAKQCDGLFIYAATAIRYISGDPESKIGRRYQTQADQLKQLLNEPRSMLTKESHIGHLYQTILDEVLCNQNGTLDNDAQMIVSTIVCAKQPLSVSILAALVAQPGEEPEEEWVGKIVNALHAMIFTQNSHIYIYHKSFLDFFPKDWIKKKDMDLTKSCMYVIKHGLHFNMCNLPSSYLLDSEVLDLPSEVQLRLGNGLGYAVQYWIPHLIQQEASDELFHSLSELMEKKVLFWVEAMNLMEKKEDCYRNVQDLQIWLAKGAAKEAAATVSRLVKAFTQTTASLSTPHLYLSSLATEFATTLSATKWQKDFANVPKVLCTGVSNHGGEILQMQYRHAVNAVAFSPDGLKLASGADNGNVCLWDALTGKQVLQMKGHTDWVHSVAFSSNGSKVISGSNDETTRIWNTETGEQEMIINSSCDVFSAVLSPDGMKVVSGSGGNTVCMWDAETGRECIEMIGHTDYINSVAFSPDGSKIISGSNDETIRIWDAVIGAQLKLIQGNSGGVHSVGFSCNGAKVVSGSWDGTICIWNALTGDQIKELVGHSNSITSVAIAPDSSKIVSGSYDRTLCIWDAVTGEQLKQLDSHTDCINSVTFSPDGSKIMSGSKDGTIRIWDAIIGDQPKLVDGHTGRVWSVAFSSDGSKILSGSADKTVCIWDALTGDKLKQMNGHMDQVFSVHFSSDGSRVVSGSYDSTVRMWDTATGRQLKQMHGHSKRVRSVTFSLSGSKIVSGSADKSVRIWDTGTGKMLKQINGHTKEVRSVSFSPDESKIVSGSHDTTVRIWDAITGEQLKQIDSHTNYVLSVAFSFDATKVVSGSGDYTVCIWNVETGEQLQEMKGHTEPVTAVAFSSDGSQVVSGSDDSMVCIWDAASGEKLKVMDGDTGGVLSVAISPDGSKVVSGSEDQTIRIWDAATGRQHKRETCHIGYALSAAPSSNHATNNLSVTQNESETLHAQWNTNNQGWIKPHHSEQCLMWLPPSLASTLITPDCLCIICHRGYSTVQFNWDCIGENWAKCYTPTSESLGRYFTSFICYTSHDYFSVS
ncbi:hypothetical protein GYMLUDRAFT_979987 [Collybiopsis luxurians FD-317 M1]|uniref:NACHT domain-containing protein n=1 Tax=Collybiopsis luxurians FD-317 M1 TaxID=944289 RepID=A0A0D0C1Q6_9AGAR|nr:hypothetical protein GYMLUDRAFT_979987 [Collybiopsis luxurians FD-317 M1]